MAKRIFVYTHNTGNMAIIHVVPLFLAALADVKNEALRYPGRLQLTCAPHNRIQLLS